MTVRQNIRDHQSQRPAPARPYLTAAAFGRQYALVLSLKHNQQKLSARHQQEMKMVLFRTVAGVIKQRISASRITVILNSSF